MTWPTRTWTQNGWVDFATPGRSPNPTGFPDDWKEHKGDIKGGNYWDVIDNPLFELAAEASGLDWDKWVAESHADIGEPGDQLVRVMTSSGSRSYTRNGTVVRQPTYEVMTVDEAYDQGYSDSDILSSMSGTGNESQGGMGAAGIGILVSGMDPDDLPGFFGGGDDDDSDGRGGWGITGDHGNWIDDMETMYSWLTQTIKTHSMQDMPIVTRGPEGSDYGIEGDIWVHYGLDQAPKAPKAMDVNYNFNLAELKPNTLTRYSTPEGYPVLDTSTESVAYEDTHYAQWTAQNEADAIAQENAEPSSYGVTESEAAAQVAAEEAAQAEADAAAAEEAAANADPTYSWHDESYEFKGDDRWIENVEKFLGDEASNIALWTELAGIKNLDSRNDSNQIHQIWSDNNGVLPGQTGGRGYVQA